MPDFVTLDAFDRKLLARARANNLEPARVTAEAVGLSESAVLRRMRRLRAEGVIARDIAVVAPDPDGPFPDGLHPISAVGGVTLVDGNVRRLSLPVVRRELRARLRR